jgi:hypothetical protein
LPDHFLTEYLIAVGSRLIEDVAELHSSRPVIPTLALETSIGFASDAERAAFMRELTAALSRLIAAYHHDDGEEFRLIVAAHPGVART